MQCQLVNNDMEMIPNEWLLLDSGSTISSIRNKDLMFDVQPLEKPLRVYSNGGHLDYGYDGSLRLMPLRVYFDRKCMANILSLSEVASKFRVTMDTSVGSSICVHINDDKVVATLCGGGCRHIGDDAKRMLAGACSSGMNAVAALMQ